MSNYYEEKLKEFGYNPDDFLISENGFTAKPTFYQRKIAKEEDEPIKTDVNDIGEVVGIALDDTMSMAETIGLLVEMIIDLQIRVEELERV